MTLQWDLGFSSALNLASSAWKNGEQPDGFAALEIAAGYHACENIAAREACLQIYQEDYERAQQQGLRLWSVHLPYGPDLDLTVEEERSEEIFTNFAAYVDATIAMTPQCYVVHAFVREPLIGLDRERLLENANKNIGRLAAYIAEKGAVLAVEALPRTNLGNTAAECMRMIAGTQAGLCLDVNHLLKEDHRTFFTVAHDCIKTVHLSDYDFLDEKHWVPGEGSLNWKELMSLFAEFHYTGALIFEAKFHRNGEEVFLKDILEGFRKAIS